MPVEYDEQGNPVQEYDEQGKPWQADSSVVQPRQSKPLSTWEKIQQQSTGFLSGLGQELPNVATRFANLGSDVYHGWKEKLRDAGALPSNPADVADEVRRAEREWKTRQAFEKASAPVSNENTGMGIGRIAARAAPQLAAGAAAAVASGGTSIPAQLAASIPGQAAVGGSMGLLQSLSEGASPVSVALQTGLGAGAPYAGQIGNGIGSYVKAPFKKWVDQAAMDAARNLGVDLPASAVTTSPLVRNIETLSGKLIGGQGITNRAAKAAKDLNAAAGVPAGAEAIRAGRNIAEDVLGAEAGVAGREAMTAAEQQAFEQAQQGFRRQVAGDLVDPQLAARAPLDLTGGLTSAKGAFRATSSQLREEVESNLGGIAANPEDFIAEVDRLIAEGTLPPGDLAYLKGVRSAVSPVKMADLGGGQLVPVDQVPAEFRALVPTVDQPRTAAEIISQVKGMTAPLPYAQGQGAFGTPALKQGLAGRLKGELGSIVTEADPALGARLSAADQFHAENVGQFKTDAAKRLFRLEKSGNVSRAADVVNPQMATEELKQLLKTTGAKPSLGANVLEGIIKRSSDKAGAVDPAKLAREMSRWRPGNLEAILDPGQLTDLKDLSRAPAQWVGPTAPAQGPQTVGEMLSGKWGKTIGGLYSSGKAGDVVESVIHTKSSPQEIAAVMQSAGPAADEVRANVLARVLKAGGDRNAKVTPESIAAEVDRWTPKRLREILTPKQYGRLQDLIVASRAMGRASKISEGSQTTPWLKTSQYLGAPQAIIWSIMTGHPLAAAGIAGSIGVEAGLSSALGSKAGQKWLTTGFSPSTLGGKLARPVSVGSSRIAAEVELAKRRRGLEDSLARQ